MRKLIILNRLLFALAIILAFYSPGFSQFEKYSIPAKWEYYFIKDKKVSFLMPRLPVWINQSNSCNGEDIRNYAAYNDGVVYILRVTSKVSPSDFCPKKKQFNEKSFLERVQALKANLKESEITDSSNGEIAVLVGENRITKLVNDYENRRWFELTVAGADEKKAEVKNFLASLKLASLKRDVTGIEIKQGAAQVFGDEVAISTVEVKLPKTANTKKEKGENLESKKLEGVKIDDLAARGVTILLKERANYSDTARQIQVQGKVVLRVTFLPNGAIGDVSVISGLSGGLTEEAIKAARKIVFIPAQQGGARYSVSKPVEYSFTIY